MAEFHASLAETPYLDRMVVVAAVAEYAAASDRRMGPPALRRRPAQRATPRRPRKHIAVSSASTQPNTRLCSRPWSMSSCRRTEQRKSRRRSCAAGSWRRWRALVRRARGRKPSCSPSRTCTGPPDFARSHVRAGRARAQAPSLIIATARPEFRPPWSWVAPQRDLPLSARSRAGREEVA